jgi:hypothetical protein
MHYTRVRRTGNAGEVGRRVREKYAEDARCAWPGCTQKPMAKDLCSNHWNQHFVSAEQRRKYFVKCTYGLDAEEHERLLKEQEGRCAVCGRVTKKDLSIDHNHETNEVRGLLCQNCNTGIGLFKEDPRLLRAAADYLDKNKK